MIKYIYNFYFCCLQIISCIWIVFKCFKPSNILILPVLTWKMLVVSFFSPFLKVLNYLKMFLNVHLIILYPYKSYHLKKKGEKIVVVIIIKKKKKIVCMLFLSASYSSCWLWCILVVTSVCLLIVVWPAIYSFRGSWRLFSSELSKTLCLVFSIPMTISHGCQWLRIYLSLGGGFLTTC